MAREFASPAECLPDLTAHPEASGLDLERLHAFADRLRTLVLEPQEILGAPFYAKYDDKSYVFGADGTSRELTAADDIRGRYLADDLRYDISPLGSGSVQFTDGFAAGAKEVYIPDERRREATDYEPTLDDIVEAKTGKKIQVVLDWENEFYPENYDLRVGVEKRFYFLSEQDSEHVTDIICVTVFHQNLDWLNWQKVYYGTFDEEDFLTEIDGNFADFITPVTADDIERLGRRLDRNIADYKALADNVRTQRLGSGLLHGVAGVFTRYRNPYPVKGVALLWAETLGRKISEHAEDDPADGSNGNFSVLAN
ncbi:MAG TPA: hypothetical protein VLG47_07575 [Candidatus Saccharimonadales bacterium]|nr:hypothetical protein [Candidatus Saccharimonadales bacterium]